MVQHTVEEACSEVLNTLEDLGRSIENRTRSLKRTGHLLAETRLAEVEATTNRLGRERGTLDRLGFVLFADLTWFPPILGPSVLHPPVNTCCYPRVGRKRSYPQLSLTFTLEAIPERAGSSLALTPLNSGNVQKTPHAMGYRGLARYPDLLEEPDPFLTLLSIPVSSYCHST